MIFDEQVEGGHLEQIGTWTNAATREVLPTYKAHSNWANVAQLEGSKDFCIYWLWLTNEVRETREARLNRGVAQ